MKHVFITGGAGFIGGHLAEKLISQGNSVTILDDLSTGLYQNIAALEGNDNFRFFVDSVLNEKLSEELVREADEVYHLASAVGVDLVVSRPVHTIESIFNTTEIILRACNRYRKPVLITSTSEVYGKGTQIPFCEEDDTLSGPTSRRRWAYANAKALDEFLALAHWYETHLPVRIARLFNTVGPRQTGQYGMVIPRFVTAALAGEPLKVFGDGNQSRCFAHVLDVVTGLTQLMESPDTIGKVVNLGNNEELSINDLAQKIVGTTNSKSTIEHIPYDEAYGPGFEDMSRRVPSLKRAEELIGYKATRNIDNIIADVVTAMQG